MSSQVQMTTVRPVGQPLDKVVPRPSWFRRLSAQRRAERRQNTRHANAQRFAYYVEQVLAGCGLSQADYSIGGGRKIYFPQVVSMIAGPPLALDVRILPGQRPSDFVAQAPAIAYHLGMAEIRVIPREPSVIRLELLQE